ncbi:hypothetical protein ACMD2_10807, partial [Ananas comosus]
RRGRAVGPVVRRAAFLGQLVGTRGAGAGAGCALAAVVGLEVGTGEVDEEVELPRLERGVGVERSGSVARPEVASWSCPVCPLASKSSPAQMKALAVSLSYLIYDLICCMFGHHFNFDNFVHHTVSIVGIGAGLAYEMILFAVIFSLARMVVGPYLTYVTLSANYPLLIKAMALGLQLVSAFWFYKILRMVRHKLGKKMKAHKSVSH